MLPDSVLSTQVVYAPFAFPRNIPKSALLDFEYGGVAIQDPSKGLRVKVWRAEYVGNEVVVSADGVVPTTVLIVDNVVELGFSFDTNMKPFVCYTTENGDASFFWFDTVTNGNVTTTLATGSHSLRCAHDDTRNTQVRLGRSDVILAYVRNKSLYFRAQRERYQTEHLLTSNLTEGAKLLQVGLNQQLRFQFRVTAGPGGGATSENSP